MLSWHSLSPDASWKEAGRPNVVSRSVLDKQPPRRGFAQPGTQMGRRFPRLSVALI